MDIMIFAKIVAYTSIFIASVLFVIYFIAKKIIAHDLKNKKKVQSGRTRFYESDLFNENQVNF